MNNTTTNRRKFNQFKAVYLDRNQWVTLADVCALVRIDAKTARMWALTIDIGQ